MKTIGILFAIMLLSFIGADAQIRIKKYNGYDSGGEGLYTINGNSTMSEAKIAAILLCIRYND